MKDWETLSQAELDDAYANADYIPDADRFLTEWPRSAAAFRARVPPHTMRYGPHPRQQIDLFHPAAPSRGLTIFVHGGYWRRFDRQDWSHLAAGALAHDQAVALPGYVLTPDVTVPHITAMMASAIDTVAAQVAGPIRLTGHSAGGHLVARMLMPDVPLACRDRVVACLPLSPVADLRPLVPQSMNADLRLTRESAAAESPVLGAPVPGIRCGTYVGAAERPSFLWQADQLAQVWGHPLHVVPGRHHFDVIDALADPESDLIADLLA